MRLTTLGGARLDGGSLSRQKPLLLLAYLAIEGPTSRRELAELFFPGTRDPRDSLATALRTLRLEAGDAIDAAGERVSTTITCDAGDLMTDFDAFRYADVVERYAGSFFEGIGLDLGVELEEWLFVTREALARRCRAARFHRARAAFGRGDLEEARREADAGVGVRGAPELDETEIGTILPIMEGTGSALAGDVRRAALDVGIDPAVAAIAPPRVGVASPQRATRPPSTSFVGRQHEFGRLRTWVLEDAAPVITIYGMGGIGKTRLATRFVDELRRDPSRPFPEGVHVVSLEHVAGTASVPAAIADALGLPPFAGRDVDALGLAIGSWRALIVLDNLEHLLDGAFDLASLVQRCPHLRLVVTSRARLDLSGERSLRLEGLPAEPTPGGVSEAAQLFLDRAARVGFEVDGASDDMVWIDALCEALDGYPLGIELAAGWTRLLPPKRVVEELLRTHDVLAGGPTDAPERHRAVRSVLEPSWHQLVDDDRRALSRLTVFQGGFQHDAAAEVAGTSLATLARLVDRSLLRVDNGRGRFHFHPLLLDFVRSKADADVVATASQEHLRHYDRLLEASAASVQDEPHRVLSRLQVELANVLHAVRTAHDGGAVDAATRMTDMLVVRCDYTQARGCTADLADVIERGIATAERIGDRRTAHHLATRLGDARREIWRDLRGALAAYEHARSLAATMPDAGREAVLTSLIAATREELDGSDGEPLFERARELAERASDELALCMVLQKWGYLAIRRGDLVRAQTLLAEAVAIASRIRDDHAYSRPKVDQVLFFALHNLGVAYDDAGDLHRSLDHRRRALALAQERSHEIWCAFAHEELGVVYHGLRDRQQADSSFRAALDLYRRHGAVIDRQDLEGRMSAWGYG
jgi:predicted ATPase